MAEFNTSNRPLSPHLQVYRLPLTAITSILTRITGQGMIPALLLIVWWMVAAVTSPYAFAWADMVVRSWLGGLVLLGGLWSVFYHLLAGLRHLYYDAGYGMEIVRGRQLSIAVLAGSAVLTVLTLLIMIVW